MLDHHHPSQGHLCAGKNLSNFLSRHLSERAKVLEDNRSEYIRDPSRHFSERAKVLETVQKRIKLLNNISI
jgi:hypothetical protein